MIITSIAKWGNSQGIRLPKEVLEQVNLKHKDKLSVVINGEEIILKKIVETNENRLKKLFENYTAGDYICKEIECTPAVGKEVF
ncbi:MAG: AbrB/MazE/SpoVT family DNA-binding domain-containing protein [Veillonellales bacterium]